MLFALRHHAAKAGVPGWRRRRGAAAGPGPAAVACMAACQNPPLSLRSVGVDMPDVKALEDAVKALPPQDLAEFRNWFAEFDLAVWDRQIDADAASGKLDALLAEAEADYRAGQRREL
jgi:hypothetical protein